MGGRSRAISRDRRHWALLRAPGSGQRHDISLEPYPDRTVKIPLRETSPKDRKRIQAGPKGTGNNRARPIETRVTTEAVYAWRKTGDQPRSFGRSFGPGFLPKAVQCYDLSEPLSLAGLFAGYKSATSTG